MLFLLIMTIYKCIFDFQKTLLLLGVSNLENWTAWFLKEFLCLLILNIIMTAMLCIRFGAAAVYQNSDAGLILFWLCLYSADVIAFAFFISTFFEKGEYLLLKKYFVILSFCIPKCMFIICL